MMTQTERMIRNTHADDARWFLNSTTSKAFLRYVSLFELAHARELDPTGGEIAIVAVRRDLVRIPIHRDALISVVTPFGQVHREKAGRIHLWLPMPCEISELQIELEIGGEGTEK